VAQTTESISDELTGRHRVAVWTIYAMIGLTCLLVALALAGVFVNTTRSRDPNFDLALRILIVFFAVGALYIRRWRFMPARLQDIASLRGTPALLKTLQKTTIYVAFIGGAIALMGFVLAMGTGNPVDMLWMAGIAVVVLLYAYPRRAVWQRVVDATENSSGRAQSPSAKGTNA
jgi:uncharacterized membrane protein YqjE